MTDQVAGLENAARTWKMTDPGTAKFCACLRKNAKEQVATVRNFARISILFRISSSIVLDLNVTDTALNSLFISHACALCGLTARFLSTSIHL